LRYEKLLNREFLESNLKSNDNVSNRIITVEIKSPYTIQSRVKSNCNWDCGFAHHCMLAVKLRRTDGNARRWGNPNDTTQYKVQFAMEN